MCKNKYWEIHGSHLCSGCEGVTGLISAVKYIGLLEKLYKNEGSVVSQASGMLLEDTSAGCLLTPPGFMLFSKYFN